MFDHLLKPKWQHSDPRKRQAALESGKLPPEALVKVALEDNDPDVRCSAIQRIDDPDLLAELLQADPVIQVREVVVRRQCELLARPLELPPSLDGRLTIIRKAESLDLCERLAQRAESVEIRTAALEQVTDIQLLCAVAVDDPVATVRRIALERINEPEGWEIVSRNARNKDKQISRAAREKLESFRQAQSDQQTAERLCREMDTMLAADSLTINSQALFQRHCDQWLKIATPLPAQISEKFDQPRSQVSVRIEQFEALMSQRRAICAEMEALFERMQVDDEDSPGFPEELAEQIKSIDARWQATDPDLHSDNPVTRRYTHLLQQLNLESERLSRDRQRMGKLRELISNAHALLEDPDTLNDNRIKQLELRWSKLHKPESSQLAQTLQNEFDDALRRLRQLRKQQTNQRKQALDEAEALLPELQQAFNHGELERALSLRDRISHRLKMTKGIAEKRRSAVQQQLNRMHVKLDELREWRHWGSGHAREHLFTEIEELIGSSFNPDEIAAKVRSARKAWQNIDHAEGPADEALWQRFDKACTSAYAPYQQQRKKQGETLKQHLAQKEKLCAELDQFERDTDWGKVDWREAEQHIHKARERWRRIGPAPRKAGKSLEKNYLAVLERLETHLAPERNRELKRRRAMIARVEELSRASDLRAASREAKDAQDKWKPTVPLPRNEEQALWQQFRSACDAVFDQLREERMTADTERQANLERRQAICAELESLLDQPEQALPEIHKRFDASRDEWSEIRNIPHKQARAIEARYEAIKERIDERQRQQAKAAAEAGLQSIRAHSQLCARLEHEVLDQTMDEAAQQALLEQSSQEWQALPDLNAENAKPLQTRFELASCALQGDSTARETLQEALEKNLQRRLQLCLQLEVAAGVDSPAEYADERMKYQVSLLANALQHKYAEQQNREDRLTGLVIAWLQTGPVRQEERGELAERFERALSADG